MTTAVVGVDLGGTRLRVGLVATDGTIVRRLECSSRADGARGDLPRMLASLCRDVAGPGLTAVGIAASGPVDAATGTIHNGFTLPAWSEIPLRDGVRDALGADVRVVMDNDTAAAAVAEARFGAGRGADAVAVVTLGTGIGAALVRDGRLLRGASGFHPEAGHLVIDPSGPLCYCGSTGCWEVLASGTAADRAAREIGLTDAAALFAAARAGEAAAADAVVGIARNVSLGLITLASVWAPRVIAIGGSLANGLDVMRPVIDRELAKVGPMLPPQRVDVVAAALGDDAGVIGAALLAGLGDAADAPSNSRSGGQPLEDRCSCST